MTIDLNRRIELLQQLGSWLAANKTEWQVVRERAVGANPWFTEQHVAYATEQIVNQYLKKELLTPFAAHYPSATGSVTVGIVMAGNVPLVGFHDFLCGFLSGHRLRMKLSSKDDVLLPYLIAKLSAWEPSVAEQTSIEERLNGCDAYIATGSNNTARYFEEYFGKYPNIIRKNRTSVAILTGKESASELSLLADDVYLYYGLGCRNVTQIHVPEGHDFVPLLQAFNKYESYADLNKYKNNYDYHLALYLLNRVPYMSNTSLLLVENPMPFSAVSVLHYQYYSDYERLTEQLNCSADIQAIVGADFIPFGKSQQPTLWQYADGIDTMEFLTRL